MMVQYFEYQDDKSSKFWEITLNGKLVITCYGKIGTVGQMSQKKFATPDAAQKEYDKLVKEKTKKGYKEKGASKKQVQPSAAKKTMGYQILTFEEANEKMDGALDVFQAEYNTVLYYEGGTTIEGDLDYNFEQKINKKEKKEIDCIVINGDLTVTGRIALYEALPGLFVSGFIKAKTLEGGDCEIYVGDGEIDYFVYGYYNDGSLEAGTIKTQFVINSDHSLIVDAPGAVFINNYSDYDDLEYDYFRQDIPTCFVKEVLDKDADSIDTHKFLARLEAGKNVLNPGAKPSREKTQEEVEKLSKENTGVSELNLSEKKLKSFPETALKIKTLKKLDLSDNKIGSVPAEIKILENLEELNLRKCNLKTLPEEIGQLKNLKVLNIAGNSSPQIPETIKELKSLEVLDVSSNTEQLGINKESNKMMFSEFKLPDAIGGLENLKALISNYNRTPLPETVTNLKKLEKVQMYGGSNVWLRDFPEYLTKIPSIKILDLSSNPLDYIPESILNFKNLEELNLDGTLGYIEKPIPDFSKLPKLKVLHFNGHGWGRTGSLVPKHEILQQLLKMNLDQLEELSLDRWGEQKEYNAESKKHEIVRNAPEPELFMGIGKFKNLRKLDLSFNRLVALPEDFYKLKNLQEINLKYNNLPKAEREKIAKAFPNTKIDFRNNSVDEKDKPAETEDFIKMKDIIKNANAKRSQNKHLEAIELYDQVLEYHVTGKVSDEYNLIYAHYSKMYVYSRLAYQMPEISENDKEEYKKKGVAEAEICLSLVPQNRLVWHFTDEGQFHEEVIRYASNCIAWNLYEKYDDQQSLEKALVSIERGIAFASEPAYFYLYDTKVRILLKLGRADDAYEIVYSILLKNPDFGDFKDLVKDKQYKNWLKQKSLISN